VWNLERQRLSAAAAAAPTPARYPFFVNIDMMDVCVCDDLLGVFIRFGVISEGHV